MDAAVASAVDGIRTDFLDSLFRIVTHLGDVATIGLLVAVLAIFLAMRGRRLEALILAVATPAGGLLNYLLKLAVDRARPEALQALIALPESPGMPSGHAFGAAMLAVLVVWVYPGAGGSRRLLIATVAVYALLVGFSRVYLGVHWASDVLVGWTLGCLWGVLTSSMGDRIMSRATT